MVDLVEEEAEVFQMAPLEVVERAVWNPVRIKVTKQSVLKTVRRLL